ncbi:MAG: ankyrin repeat domain-containing protein [Vicinamibacteraceae bacterium]
MSAPLSPFDDALAALHAGEIARLRGLIAEEPLLLHLRAEAKPPLGYFSGATLLNHVAGNPGWNELRGFGAATVAIAGALLDAGAEADARTLGPPASTTMGLVITSRQASDANLSASLIDVLRAHGAALDVSTPGVLDAPLSNHAPRAAQAMIALGAKIDLCAAAALGDLSRVGAAFDDRGRLREEVRRQGRELTAREAIGLALLFAYVNQQPQVVDALLERDGDWNMTGVLNGTALHRAAGAGDLDMVQRLVALGADASDRTNPFTSTPFGWAVHNRQETVAAWFRASGHVDLHDAVSHDLAAEIEARLREDPDEVNRRRDHWNIPAGTPLHWAAARNLPFVARVLLANGALANLPDGRGRTPLDHAAERNATAVSAILVQHGGRRSSPS